MVIVAASGNESNRQKNPKYEVSASVPAAARGIVSVGALGETGDGLNVADFSNTNPMLSAPGVNVVSAKAGGGLVALKGTSMACPHAAGCRGSVVAEPEAGRQHTGNRERGGDPHARNLPDRCIPSRR